MPLKYADPVIAEDVVPKLIERVTAPDEENIPVLRSKLLRASVPLVNVVVPVAVVASADLNDVIPEVLLITNAASVALALLVILPVPTMVGVMVVYVPVADNVRSPAMFSAVVPGLNEVVPKFRLSNQLAVVNVATDAPVVNVKPGALVTEPPAVAPKLNVLVLLISATVNPPVPVRVNPVAVAMFNTVVVAVVCVRLMLPALVLPKAIERTPAPVELNMPVVSVAPSANVNVPAVNVYVPVTVNA